MCNVDNSEGQDLIEPLAFIQPGSATASEPAEGLTGDERKRASKVVDSVDSGCLGTHSELAKEVRVNEDSFDLVGRDA